MPRPHASLAAMGEEQEPGHQSLSRVEAFSDGVIAIIITIMVLELKAPVEEGPHALLALWPTFLAYVLSYVYVAIYWVNHHRLLSHARQVRNGLLWANIALLFALSLVPFATAYLGEHAFAREATLLYLAAMLLPALAYAWLQQEVMREEACTPAGQRYLTASKRKGLAANLVYLLGMVLTMVSPWLGVGSAALVALFWCLPSSRLDKLFLPAARH